MAVEKRRSFSGPCLVWALLAFSGRAIAQDRVQTVPPSGTKKQDEQAQAAAAKVGQRLADAAAQGNPDAQAILGWVDESLGYYADAAAWYRLAASQGNAKAQGSLGRLYQTGQGVLQDFAEAFRWSKAAADQGDPLGALNLSLINAVGEGRPKDSAESTKWARKAAEQDCESRSRLASVCAEAQGLLGASYLDGNGVPQDYVQAYMWSNLAAATLSRPGSEAERAKIVSIRDEAAKRMTPEQIGTAQRLTREWKPIDRR
jgi:TPR repeat protein